jgi:hypothetical protein
VRSERGMAKPRIGAEMSASGMSTMVSGPLRGEGCATGAGCWGGAALERHQLGRRYEFEFVDLSGDPLARIAVSCKRFGMYRRTRAQRLGESGWGRGDECKESLSRGPVRIAPGSPLIVVLRELLPN